MSESVRRLKANRPMEGKPCAVCSRPLAFGDDAAVCTGCEALCHASCWDQRGGCATPGCENAPVPRLSNAPSMARVVATPPALGKKECPHCGKLMRTRDAICPHCKQAPTPDGVYAGPKTDAPGAVASMVWGIVGLLVCGLILGIIAITKSNEVKRAIARDPRLGGGGYATAGLVLGIIDIVGWGLILLVKLTSRGGY